MTNIPCPAAVHDAAHPLTRAVQDLGLKLDAVDKSKANLEQQLADGK